MAFATLACGAAAYAADPYGGFGSGPNEPATQDMGAEFDPGQAGSAPEADLTLPWLQPQSQNQPESYNGPWDRGPVSGEYDMDDEGGH